MPNSVEQICRKYEARLRAGRMGPVTEERARLQLARFRRQLSTTKRWSAQPVGY